MAPDLAHLEPVLRGLAASLANRPPLFSLHHVSRQRPNIASVGDLDRVYVGSLGWLTLRVVSVHPQTQHVPWHGPPEETRR